MLDEEPGHERIVLIDIRHARYEPAIAHFLFIDRSSIRIHQRLVFVGSIGISGPEMEPAAVRHFPVQKMFKANMVVHGILDDLHTALMYCIDKTVISFDATEPWIDAVMVGGCIAMFGAVGHIVFQHRVQPKGCYADVLQVIEMVLDPFQISSMPVEDLSAVEALIFHAGDPVVGRIAIAEAVGHDEIHEVFCAHSFDTGAAIAFIACFQYVFYLLRALPFPRKTELQFTRFGIAAHQEIDGQVIRIPESVRSFQLQAGIGFQRNSCFADTRRFHQQLY